MNKFIAWSRDEDARKLLTSIVMFLLGLGTLLFGFTLGHKSVPMCILFCILGIIAGFLGAIPLVARYSNWQGMDD